MKRSWVLFLLMLPASCSIPWVAVQVPPRPVSLQHLHLVLEWPDKNGDLTYSQELIPLLTGSLKEALPGLIRSYQVVPSPQTFSDLLPFWDPGSPLFWLKVELQVSEDRTQKQKKIAMRAHTAFLPPAEAPSGLSDFQGEIRLEEILPETTAQGKVAETDPPV